MLFVSVMRRAACESDTQSPIVSEICGIHGGLLIALAHESWGFGLSFGYRQQGYAARDEKTAPKNCGVILFVRQIFMI